LFKRKKAFKRKKSGPNKLINIFLNEINILASIKTLSLNKLLKTKKTKPVKENKKND